jgi:hypothetical protein
MARDVELIQKRNKAIRDAFKKLAAERPTVTVGHHKVAVTLNSSQIFLILRDQFHLTTRTLEDIVYPPNRPQAAPAAKQLDMFPSA